MSKVISILQNIINTGVDKINDPEKAKRIKLTNLIALTVFLTGTPFTLVFYYYANKISASVLGLYVLSFLLVFQLLKKGWYLFARMLMITIMNVAVIHYSFWYGHDTGLHYMLIPFACVPFLVLSRKSKWLMFFGSFISLMGFIIIDFIPYEPMLSLLPEQKTVIYYCITAMSLIWLVLEMIYLTNQNHYAVKELLEQRKDRTSAIVNAQENERKRVARDLHDSLGQLLSAIKINLERYPDKEHAAIQNAKALAEKSVNEMRHIAFNLMPNTLEEKGMESALMDLISRIRSATSQEIYCEVSGIDLSRIEKEKQHNIYRIIQEGLNNAIKHSSARNINVQLTAIEDKLSVMIEDDGIGFAPSYNNNTGRGLNNIKARTNWLDGTFSIDSGSEIGTTLIVEIPIEEII